MLVYFLFPRNIEGLVMSNSCRVQDLVGGTHLIKSNSNLQQKNPERKLIKFDQDIHQTEYNEGYRNKNFNEIIRYNQGLEDRKITKKSLQYRISYICQHNQTKKFEVNFKSTYQIEIQEIEKYQPFFVKKIINQQIYINRVYYKPIKKISPHKLNSIFKWVCLNKMQFFNIKVICYKEKDHINSDWFSNKLISHDHILQIIKIEKI
ncbi:unnamed protein product [Paramecium octaurelia]|uniref:Uncharacterized protein n=1 Tax=Paramecium octaurelia TaxID=43137 RepID=A0A8S1YI09_PAROT|nr:unnamed protein product [Paramecium octaurelia]